MNYHISSHGYRKIFVNLFLSIQWITYSLYSIFVKDNYFFKTWEQKSNWVSSKRKTFKFWKRKEALFVSNGSRENSHAGEFDINFGDVNLLGHRTRYCRGVSHSGGMQDAWVLPNLL